MCRLTKSERYTYELHFKLNIRNYWKILSIKRHFVYNVSTFPLNRVICSFKQGYDVIISSLFAHSFLLCWFLSFKLWHWLLLTQFPKAEFNYVLNIYLSIASIAQLALWIPCGFRAKGTKEILVLVWVNKTFDMHWNFFRSLCNYG